MDDGIQELSKLRTETFFNGNHLKEKGNQFVAWIDLMGVQDALVNDHKTPAIWRGELLAEIHEHVNLDKVGEVFCVGDGVVIMSNNEDYLMSFLRALFSHYVKFNIHRYGDWEPYYHRLIRAGTGSGRVFQIDIEEFDRDNHGGAPFAESFRNEPFGPGVIEAFSTEGGAPFSIQTPEDGAYKWWKDDWIDGTRNQKQTQVLEMLQDYFDYFSGAEKYSYKPYETEHHKEALSFFEGHEVDFQFEEPK